MKLYYVETDKERTFITQDKSKAIEDFNNEIEEIESEEIETSEQFVHLKCFELDIFGEYYKKDDKMDTDDIIDDCSDVLKIARWFINDNDFAEIRIEDVEG